MQNINCKRKARRLKNTNTEIKPESLQPDCRAAADAAEAAPAASELAAVVSSSAPSSPPFPKNFKENRENPSKRRIKQKY